MGFSLTDEEIKELCRKKLREVLGMQPRRTCIHLVAYDVYGDGKTLQWIDFNLYNPNLGILVKYHINYVSTTTNQSASKWGTFYNY